MSAENQDRAAPNAADFVVVDTTLPSTPLAPNSERAEVLTERLVLRPPRADDLEPMHILRTQPEVMVWTGTGRPDRNTTETQAKLDPFLPPNDAKTFNYAICWRETDEFIGVGGCHRYQGAFGWPELGYMIRKEFWGRGLATELVKGFLEAYACLPRTAVQLRVDRRSVLAAEQQPQKFREILVAFVEAANARSHSVMRKCGFERFAEYTEADLRDPSKTVDLVAYRYVVGQYGSSAKPREAAACP